MRRTLKLSAVLIAIAGAGCAGPDTRTTDIAAVDGGLVRDPAAVTGKSWQWVATVTPLARTEVPHPDRYRIHLQPDGKLVARFDCNRGGGSYQISDGILSFGPLISTRMACPDGSLDAGFMRDLQRVKSFFVRDGQLYLQMPADSGTLRFRQSEP
jgi:heat shock protein HslJ